jgi:hypothetical protein
MKKIITILTIVFCINVNAQSGWLWAKSAGGTGDDYGNSVATDDSGFVYVTGSFQFGTAYYYITKYNAAGNSVWTKFAGGNTTNNAGSGIATDHNGNIYVTGDFTNASIILGTDTLKNDSAGFDDIFLAKYDRNGNVLWAKSAGGKYSDDSKGISIDNSGNVYITGSLNATATFGTYTITSGAFITKYDQNGTVLWAKSAGGGLSTSISADGLGNTYITGFYGSATITFGSVTLTNSDPFGGTWDIFVFKFDASGNALWGKTAGSTQIYDGGNAVTTDSIGNVYVTGFYQSASLSFGGITINNNGAQEYFIVKYSPNGIPLWAQSAGGANWDNGNGVTLDKDGGVYAIGNFSTDITFGAFTLHNISPGTYDAFMVKYDPYGAVLWAQSAGGTSNDTPNDVAVSHDKSAYITGYYSSPTMSFGNQTITNLGNSTNDVFLAKYYACSDVNELNICLVTTDTLGQYNIVYWDNPHIKSIDSILVYRFDIVSNGYLQIGAVSGDSLSQFTDTAFSIGGPNGGNPQYSSWQYKIAVRDTCGNISMKSPYHQSIFIQENGSNFSWNSYFIEAGQTNPITGYQFQRDDNNTGNWHVLVNTSGLSSTDPNHTLYPNGNWRVDALGFNCIPTTLRLANNNNNNNTDAAKVRSHSNQNNNRMSGIKQVQPNNN